MSEVVAISTYQTYLMYRTTTSGSYTKLIDIKDYPDVIQEPNRLDATTLSHGRQIMIPGIIQDGSGMSFTANYTKANFKKVRDLEGYVYDYALWLGADSNGAPDGHNGMFSWSGEVRAGFPGKGVDEVQDMTITMSPTTDVYWSEGSL